MKKTGIFYGSTTGTTEAVARTIAQKLNIPSADIHDVSTMNEIMVTQYEALILGTSTWGDGELQDDWYDGIKILKETDLKGKTIALFGCGDSESYADTFCDGMGCLYEAIKNSGCILTGTVSTDGYTFSASSAVADGLFVGLPIDEMNENELTETRITQWTERLQQALA